MFVNQKTLYKNFFSSHFNVTYKEYIIAVQKINEIFVGGIFYGDIKSRESYKNVYNG